MWVILILGILIIIGLIPEKPTLKKEDKSSTSKYYNQDSAFYNNTGFGKNTVIKKFLIDERGPYCENCGEEIELQVDHIVPVSRGGTDDMENLQLLCYECHQKKHNYEFDEIGTSNQKATGKYKKIRDAIDGQKKIKIKYEAYSGEVTERIILPQNIVLKDGKEYLKAYCYLRNENREFKISRIKKITSVNNE